MGILPSCSRVNTTVMLHYLDFKETLGDKGRWKLPKHAGCCFENKSQKQYPAK